LLLLLSILYLYVYKFDREKNGWPTKEVDNLFPIPYDTIVQSLIPLKLGLESKINLIESLNSIHFLATLKGDLSIKLLYSNKIINETEWIHSITLLRKYIYDYFATNNYKIENIHFIGISKNQKIWVDSCFVEEILMLEDNRLCHYIQSVDAFSNPNAYVNIQALNWISKLLRKIKLLYNDKPIDFLELYCGCGNHTIVIAPYVNNLLAVEISPVLVDAAKNNLLLNNINNVKIICGDSKKFTTKILRKVTFHYELISYNFQIVLVDPPRCGLDNTTRELISKYDYIIYISCSPESLQRDLSYLKSTHCLDDLAFFDQFAYTPHIETGVMLRKIKLN